jgi:hypothetical protein
MFSTQETIKSTEKNTDAPAVEVFDPAFGIRIRQIKIEK